MDPHSAMEPRSAKQNLDKLHDGTITEPHNVSQNPREAPKALWNHHGTSQCLTNPHGTIAEPLRNLKKPFARDSQKPCKIFEKYWIRIKGQIDRIVLQTPTIGQKKNNKKNRGLQLKSDMLACNACKTELSHKNFWRRAGKQAVYIQLWKTNVILNNYHNAAV